ncbi:MAG: ABC transporter permease, partial [Ginsengibacter sp.]
MKSYSQLRAMFAITKASLRAIFRSPSAVVFGFAFPLIFILVFGFIGNNGSKQSFKIAIDDNADTANELYNALKNTQGVALISYHNKDSLADDMRRGRIAGVINIQKNSSGNPPYNFTLRSTNSSDDKWPQF